jgi:hypothetical protein
VEIVSFVPARRNTAFAALFGTRRGRHARIGGIEEILASGISPQPGRSPISDICRGSPTENLFSHPRYEYARFFQKGKTRDSFTEISLVDIFKEGGSDHDGASTSTNAQTAQDASPPPD